MLNFTHPEQGIRLKFATFSYMYSTVTCKIRLKYLEQFQICLQYLYSTIAIHVKRVYKIGSVKGSCKFIFCILVTRKIKCMDQDITHSDSQNIFSKNCIFEQKHFIKYFLEKTVFLKNSSYASYAVLDCQPRTWLLHQDLSIMGNRFLNPCLKPS